MQESGRRISFDEFANNLADVIDSVIAGGETVLVETGSGQIVVLNALQARQKTKDDWAAFYAAAGSWADVDTDAFLRDVYASRQSSRPLVDL